jgi:hypothetical protein
MKMSTTAKRIGLAQIEVVVKDFIASGFLAMFTTINAMHTFRVAENQTLELRYADAGKVKRIYFTRINEISGRKDVIVYMFNRGDLAEVTVEPTVGGQAQSYIALAYWLAAAITTIQDSLTVDGEERIYYPGGTGYSAIDGDNAAEAFVRMRNNGTPGVAN